MAVEFLFKDQREDLSDNLLTSVKKNIEGDALSVDAQNMSVPLVKDSAKDLAIIEIVGNETCE